MKNLLDILSNYLQKASKLEAIVTQFKQNFNMIPFIGVEIEFYLSENINVNELSQNCNMEIKKEKGHFQYEIDIPPSCDVIEYINNIHQAKLKIEKLSKELGGNANFLPKPFLQDYGNSMHFHINFLDIHGSPVDITFINQAANAISHYMLDSFLIFAPNASDYLRFDAKYMAPTNVSFGNNNRTVAIRIPDLYPKRLEHRLSNPTTDPYLALFTILNSIYLGIKYPGSIKNYDKIYGNAFDSQYSLAKFPVSPDKALELFNIEFFVS